MARSANPSASGTSLAKRRDNNRNLAMLKILLWIVVIIFLIGLLVVTGILDLIF